MIKYHWWPCLQACPHVVLVCTLVHCLHVGITHASTGARQVYDYFRKGFPCIWKPYTWSMWYGNRALLDVEGNVQEYFEKVVEGPRHVEGSKESPAGLRDLMQRCWDEKLDNRPDASECYKNLTQLYQKFGAPSP